MVRSAVLTQTRPPLGEPLHTRRTPPFPDGGWVRRFRFLLWVNLDVVAAPLTRPGGVPLSPCGEIYVTRATGSKSPKDIESPKDDRVDVDDSVL